MAAPIKAVGPKSDKLWRQAIMLAVNRLAKDGNTKHLDIIASRLVIKAAEGDVAAMREIGDRLDGKPTQDVAIEHSGDVTLKSVVISHLNSFFAEAAGRLEDQSDKDVVSN